MLGGLLIIVITAFAGTACGAPPTTSAAPTAGGLDVPMPMMGGPRVDEASDRAFARVVVDVVEVGGVPFEEGTRTAVGGARALVRLSHAALLKILLRMSRRVCLAAHSLRLRLTPGRR